MVWKKHLTWNGLIRKLVADQEKILETQPAFEHISHLNLVFLLLTLHM